MPEFEKEYFDAAYGGEYEKCNPLRKNEYYLKHIRDVKPSGTLLDIGCAYGLFISVAGKYYNVSGCDVSAHALEMAKGRLPGVTLFRSDVSALETGKTYDVVTCFDVLEHVRDLDAAMKKIKNVLNINGIVALTVPVYDTLAGRIVGLLDMDETHLWKRGRIFWREKLKEHNFKLLKDIGLWRYCLLKRYYFFFGGSFLRNFSPAVFLIGRKDDIRSPSSL